MFGCPDKAIHPLLRRADFVLFQPTTIRTDSSPLTKGRREKGRFLNSLTRFIPSYEGQTNFLSLCLGLYAIHPLLRRADLPPCSFSPSLSDSSPRFIPSYEGQTLSVYAAFNHSKHPVVHFAQTPFSPHHMPSSLYLICRKNIFFITFLNIFQNSSTLIPYSSSITISLHSPTRYIFTSLKMPVSG